MQRNIRRSIDVGLTGLGMGTIISAVLLGSTLDIGEQLPVTLVGILLLCGGIWHLSHKVSAPDRVSTDLRKEGDHIIHLLRQLHAAAIEREKKKGHEGAEARFQSTLIAMHNSVKRMAVLASNENKSTDKPA